MSVEVGEACSKCGNEPVIQAQTEGALETARAENAELRAKLSEKLEMQHLRDEVQMLREAIGKPGSKARYWEAKCMTWGSEFGRRDQRQKIEIATMRAVIAAADAMRHDFAGTVDPGWDTIVAYDAARAKIVGGGS